MTALIFCNPAACRRKTSEQNLLYFAVCILPQCVSNAIVQCGFASHQYLRSYSF